MNFCQGFMYIDLPWFNTYFSNLLSNLSEKSPHSFRMFYQNLNFASTYLFPFLIFLAIQALLKVCSIVYKMYGQNLPLTTRRKTVQNTFTILHKYIMNLFFSGLIVSSVQCLIGIWYNPLTFISLSGSFYILGILIFFSLVVTSAINLTSPSLTLSNCRIIVKGTLMTMMFISPVPLFGSTVVIDGCLLFW